MWGSIQHFDPQRVGIALLNFGVALICFKRLETKNLAADEIFNLGRERGEADGYDEGFRDGVEEGEKSRQRPVVVPMSPRCADCGHCSAQAVPVALDRV